MTSSSSYISDHSGRLLVTLQGEEELLILGRWFCILNLPSHFSFFYPSPPIQFSFFYFYEIKVKAVSWEA